MLMPFTHHLILALAIFVQASSCQASFIAIHESLVAKPFLNEATCFDFADNYLACLHTADPELIPGTLVSGLDGYFTHADCLTQGTWNLVRIQQDKMTTRKNYGYDPSVQPVDVYVVDSFIDIKHSEFQGRASLGFKNVEGYKNQHGTHVATIIAGKNVGVAKNANIISVQVLDDDGRGKWSGLLAGLSYISRREVTYSTTIIVNLSIGGSLSTVVNKAVELLFKQGIIVVVAAGNSAKLACETSPAGATGAIVVASSNIADKFSTFSNYGSCVSIIAPGENIKAGIPGGGYGLMTGTSMAAPHVSGVLANYVGSLYNKKISPYCAATFISLISTKDAITGNMENTENKFLYSHDAQYCQDSLLNRWFPRPYFNIFQ